MQGLSDAFAGTRLGRDIEMTVIKLKLVSLALFDQTSWF